jgi:hypothetical protein
MGSCIPVPGSILKKSAISTVAELSISVVNLDHRKDRLRPQSAARDEFSRKKRSLLGAEICVAAVRSQIPPLLD